MSTTKTDEKIQNPYHDKIRQVLILSGRYHDVEIVSIEDNEKKIITCVCLEVKDEKTQSVNEIRTLINKKVPEYYMPQRIFFVGHAEMMEIQNSESLQYLLNRRCDTGSAYEEPSNKYEFVLCAIFGRILKIGQIGVNDNFFSLGGNFSMASQLVEEIRNSFRTEVPISLILHTDLTASRLASQLYAYQLLRYDSEKIEMAIHNMIP